MSNLVRPNEHFGTMSEETVIERQRDRKGQMQEGVNEDSRGIVDC
jgi:hypothetical protein